jgi:hypothetical protein
MGCQGIGVFWTIYLIKPCFSSGNGSQLAANTQKTDSALVTEVRFDQTGVVYQGLMFSSLKAVGSATWPKIPQFLNCPIAKARSD